MALLQPALPLPGSTALASASATAAGAADAARIREVARELEGQFARMMIQCMREASFGDALFPGEDTLFRDLYDQQIARALTDGQGLGLAPMIARQLGAEANDPSLAPAASQRDFALSEYRRLLPAADAVRMLDVIAGRPDVGTTRDASLVPLGKDMHGHSAACDRIEAMATQATHPDAAQFAPGTPEHFVAGIWPLAQQAARELGVDPRALAAQAALETGWGQRRIRREDGGDAHNLFGIKATGWDGARTRAATHEYVDGVRRDEAADFRAYASPAESFADYVRLLKHSPRYRQALQAGQDVHGFARGLQQAGYATDPTYATKIAAIAHGPTLDRALAALGGTTVRR